MKLKQVNKSLQNSYFIILAHDIRGRCCWYSSRTSTFLPIILNYSFFCYEITSQWQFDKTASDMKGSMCITEFFHAGKTAPINIY